MELLSKPPLSCSYGHCCARGEPAVSFQPDFMSHSQLELPGACLNQIKEKQNRVKGLPCPYSFSTSQSPMRFLQQGTALCSWAPIWMGMPVGYGLGRAGRWKAMGSQTISAGAAAMQGLTMKSKENVGLSDHPAVSPSSLCPPSWQREGINISLVTTLK